MSRRPPPLTAIVISVLLAACSGGGVGASPSANSLAGTSVATVAGSSTPTTGPEVAVPSTSAIGPDVGATTPAAVMHCGPISTAASQDKPELGDSDDPVLGLALEWFVDNDWGPFWVDTVAWGVWTKSSDEMVLYGRRDDGYFHATFVKDGDSWRSTGWGRCHWRVTMERRGLGIWRLDGPVGPDTTTLGLAATETNCANGKSPEGRDVESLVWETEESVTIFVFVEPVSGFATCPGNPEFPVTVQLGSPLGDRTLYDGFEVPPVERSSEGTP